MSYFFRFVLLCCLLSCGNATKEKDGTNDTVPKTNQEIINSKTIAAIDFIDFGLSNEAEKNVQEWNKYQELAIQIEYLKKGDLTFFKDEPDTLKVFLDSLKNGLPVALQSNPIESRINVLTTAILKLNDDLTLDNIPYEDKLFTLKQVLSGFSSLNYSIDEKLEREFYDQITPE